MAKSDRTLPAEIAGQPGLEPLQSWLVAFVGALRRAEAGEGLDARSECVLGQRIAAIYRGRPTLQRSALRASIFERTLAHALGRLRWPKAQLEVESMLPAGSTQAPALAVCDAAGRTGRVELHRISWYRRFGIGLRADDSQLELRLHQLLLRAVLQRLADELEALPAVLTTLGADRLKPRRTKLVPERIAQSVRGDAHGDRFELLLQWILDTGSGRAREASLREDLLEATDLRYVVAGGPAKGARIQVTRSVSPVHLEAKRARADLRGAARKLIWLSPRELAVFVLAEPARIERMVVECPELLAAGTADVSAWAQCFRQRLVAASLEDGVVAGVRGPLAGVGREMIDSVRGLVHAGLQPNSA